MAIKAGFELLKPDTEPPTRLALAQIQSKTADTLYTVQLNWLIKTDDLYYPQVVLSRAVAGDSIKRLTYTLSEGIKDNKNDVLLDINIKNFNHNQVAVALLVNKNSYQDDKGMQMTATTEVAPATLTVPAQMLGNTAQTGLPAILYSYHYRWGKNDEGFAFKSSTGQPVSLSKRIAANYSAVPNANSKIAQTTREYNNSVGDKQYELSNHLGNVLSVITDQKLLNIQRGTPVFEARFDDDAITPFSPTPQITEVINKEHRLVIVNQTGTPEQGAYTTLTLQTGKDYVLNFDIPYYDLESMFEVVISDNTSGTVYKQLIEEGKAGHMSFPFTVPDNEVYTLSFLTYESAKGYFSLDNIEILDVTGLNPEEVANNSQEMPIFVPSVLSFSDYYPFGMMMPGRHGESSFYRYGFQGQEKDDEVKGKGNSLNYKYRMHDPRIGRFFAVDPLTKKYPWYTPYSFSGNKVINSAELEGMEERITIFLKSGDGYNRAVFDGVDLVSRIYDNNGNVMSKTSLTADQYQALRKNYWSNLSNSNTKFSGSDSYKRYKEPPTTGNLIVVPSDNKQSNYVYIPTRIHKHKRLAARKVSLKESFDMGMRAHKTFFVEADPLVDGSEASVRCTKNIKTGIELYATGVGVGMVLKAGLMARTGVTMTNGRRIVNLMNSSKKIFDAMKYYNIANTTKNVSLKLYTGDTKGAVREGIGFGVSLGTTSLVFKAINNNPLYNRFVKEYLKAYSRQHIKLFNSAAKGLTKEIQNRSN